MRVSPPRGLNQLFSKVDLQVLYHSGTDTYYIGLFLIHSIEFGS